MAFDKNKALKRVKERETKVLIPLFFSSSSLCFCALFSLRLLFASVGDDELFKRREWKAEKRIRFLYADDEDAIFGNIHPRSSSFDNDDFDEWCFVLG